MKHRCGVSERAAEDRQSVLGWMSRRGGLEKKLRGLPSCEEMLEDSQLMRTVAESSSAVLLLAYLRVVQAGRQIDRFDCVHFVRSNW